MTPSEVEACAKRAYEIFAANTTEAATWDQVKNKEAWLDAVRSHEQHPGAIARNESPNLQERCVAEAYRETYMPVVEQPLVVPPVVAEVTAETTVTVETSPEKLKGNKAK